MSSWCKYEDFNKAECVNCFNGLPRTECQADKERNQLRELVHSRAEHIRKETYNKAIDDFVREIALSNFLHSEQMKHIRYLSEQLKGGNNNDD